MRLAVVGSQLKAWELPHQQWMADGVIYGALKILQPKLVISGGADGVDTWAEENADRIGIPKLIRRPHGTGWFFYKERNIQIANDCSHLLCIRSTLSKTYGSGWTADYAESLGKTVWRIVL